MGVNHGRNPQPQGRRKCQTTESDNTAVNTFYFPQKTFLKIFLEYDSLFIYTEGRGALFSQIPFKFLSQHEKNSLFQANYVTTKSV